MSYFASDTDISSEFFNSQTVPGTNSIPTARNTSFKDRSQARVKKALGLKIADSNPTDHYGTLKEAFLECYKILVGKGGEDKKGVSLSLWSEEFIVKLNNILGLDTGFPLKVTEQWSKVHGSKFGSGYY